MKTLVNTTDTNTDTRHAVRPRQRPFGDREIELLLARGRRSRSALLRAGWQALVRTLTTRRHAPAGAPTSLAA